MKEIVERNKILQITTGSHLYGTNVATSDEDYVGIFIAPEKFYLGLSTVNEVDLSIVSKNVDGKNNSDAIDSKFYELRKFVRLALDNNPNVVEILFCNPENIIFKNSEAETLLSYAHLFPHQGCIQKFIGYSKSQLHKARVKPDNYKSLTDAKEYLEKMFERGIKGGSPISLLLGEGCPDFIKGGEYHIAIGDLKFNFQVKIIDVYLSITTRIEKASHRADGFLKLGMDSKFMMHCIRLLLEGKELLTTGKITFPLKEAPFLLDIRNGKYSYEELNNIANDMTLELDSIKSDLPLYPRFNEVDSLLIQMVKQHW